MTLTTVAVAAAVTTAKAIEQERERHTHTDTQQNQMNEPCHNHFTILRLPLPSIALLPTPSPPPLPNHWTSYKIAQLCNCILFSVRCMLRYVQCMPCFSIVLLIYQCLRVVYYFKFHTVLTHVSNEMALNCSTRFCKRTSQGIYTHFFYYICIKTRRIPMCICVCLKWPEISELAKTKERTKKNISWAEKFTKKEHKYQHKKMGTNGYFII